MSFFDDTRLLDIAPLLPVTTALAYVAFVIFGWEQALLRRISGAKTHETKETEVLLPIGVTDSEPRESTTWTSSFISAAVPMAHCCITSPKLWTLKSAEKASLGVCLVQIAIVMIEFLIHYIKYHDWTGGRLSALGVAWGMMALRSLSLAPDNKLTDVTTSACIATVGVFSILPEPAAATRNSFRSLNPGPIKHKEAGSQTAEVRRSRALHVAYHIFSVSLLLVYLLHDYPSLSDQVLYRFSWLGSMSHYLMAYGLLLLRDGVDNWQGTWRSEQTLMQHLQAFFSKVFHGTPKFVRGGMLVPLSAICPWFCFFFLTNYMTSCLGFRRLLLDQPRTVPRFLDGGIFGGFMYQMLLLGQLHIRREDIARDSAHKSFSLLMAFSTAFGQTVTTVVVLATVFYICRSLAGWQ
jgi:hypothetical protein